jgi:hypothetical protein
MDLNVRAPSQPPTAPHPVPTSPLATNPARDAPAVNQSQQLARLARMDRTPCLLPRPARLYMAPPIAELKINLISK